MRSDVVVDAAMTAGILVFAFAAGALFWINDPENAMFGVAGVTVCVMFVRHRVRVVRFYLGRRW